MKYLLLSFLTCAATACAPALADEIKVGDVVSIAVGSSRTELPALVTEPFWEGSFVVKFCDSAKYRWVYYTGGVEGDVYGVGEMKKIAAGTPCRPVKN